MTQDEHRLQLVRPAKPARPLGSDSSWERALLRVVGLEIPRHRAYAIGVGLIAAIAAAGILGIVHSVLQ